MADITTGCSQEPERHEVDQRLLRIEKQIAALSVLSGAFHARRDGLQTCITVLWGVSAIGLLLAGFLYTRYRDSIEGPSAGSRPD